MTAMRYEWTPASEPPDSARWVQARMLSLFDEVYECMVIYVGGRFRGDKVIEWRDIRPPSAKKHTA